MLRQYREDYPLHQKTLYLYHIWNHFQHIQLFVFQTFLYIKQLFLFLRHEVFLTVETEDKTQDEMVIEELEPGYRFKEKLIKAAKVKIAKLKQ